ncbi:MAG: TlpA disulfide reductase family protein [Nibricoccus sp.]
MKKLAVVFVALLLTQVSCRRSEPQVENHFAARPAPSWKLQTIDGKELASTELAGKVQVINFWATWCPPCKAEIPGFITVQEKLGREGLVIVGISLDQDGADVVKRFAENNKMNYPVVMSDGKIDTAFGQFEGIPTTFIVDRKGVIRAMDTGYMSADQLEKTLRPLLDEKS